MTAVPPAPESIVRAWLPSLGGMSTVGWIRIVVLLLLIAVALTTPGFISEPSINAVLTTTSYAGCVAIGMTFITISGNIMTFCLGATTAASTVIFLVLLNRAGLAVAIVGTLAIGALATAAQGWIIGWFRANPIIVGIAVLALIRGGFQAGLGGTSIYPNAREGLELLKGQILGLPIEFIIMLLGLAICQAILSLTVFGRNLFLVGSSQPAARAAGIVSWRTVSGAYLWAGLFAALPGIMLAARFGEGNMEYGEDYDYDAIAAVLLGGTAMVGGQGSALRTLFGVTFITVVRHVLLLHGFSEQWQYFVLGVIVLSVILLQGSSSAAARPTALLTRTRMSNPHLRPFLVLLATIVLLAVLDGGEGRILTGATVFSALQNFADVGLVALGLGLTMMTGGYDLSVAGMVGMAGCIAVIVGADAPLLGIVAATLCGLAAGVCQALLVERLRVNSTSVALGGLLLFVGVAYVITDNQSVPYANMSVALAVNAPVAGVLSLRSIVTLAIFFAAALLIGGTRLGRDLIAVGSDRRAARLAGVGVDALLVGIFGFSGAMAALSGALLSYSLASASPTGLSDVLLPATAAAILGGVSLSGGTGRPIGIAMGAMTLAVLHAGLNGLGASPAVHDILTGAILLTVALSDGADTPRRFGWPYRKLKSDNIDDAGSARLS
jgi:ribose/xylose/arabinose/galactoside ABC-type transport system permease subunit